MTSRDWELLGAYLDGTLSAADHAELQTLLRTSATARAKLRALAKIDTGLSDLAAIRDITGHGGVSPATSTDTRRRSRRWQHAALYGLIAAVAVVLTVVVQGVWQHQHRGREGNDLRVATVPSFAQIVRLEQCEWAVGVREHHVGDRLSAQRLQLKAGRAELLFTSGPRITLVGPADLRIESATAATLSAGRLEFHNDRPDSTFDLQTPYSELVDLGTSYGVTLGPGFEEVRVFEGEVWRTPKNDADSSVLIDAGSARRFGHALPLFGETIAANDSRPASAAAASDCSERRVSETFALIDGSYEAGKLPSQGSGWATPWEWHARNSAGSVVEDVPLTVTDGAAVGWGIFYLQRRLAQPIRLANDAVTWFSVGFCWDAVPSELRDTFFVTLRTSDEMSAVGPTERFVTPILGHRGNILVRFGGVTERRPVSVQRGRPLRLVGRIEAHLDQPDRISLTLLADDVPLPAAPPDSWAISSRPIESDGLLDLLVFHIQSTAPIRIGDVRLADDWERLVGPLPVKP